MTLCLAQNFLRTYFYSSEFFWKFSPMIPQSWWGRAAHFGKRYLGWTRWRSQPRAEVTTEENSWGWEGIRVPPWGPGVGGRGGPQDGDTGVSLSRTTPQKAFRPALGRTGLWDKPSWGLRLPAWLRHHSECGVQGNLGPGHLSRSSVSASEPIRARKPQKYSIWCVPAPVTPGLCRLRLRALRCGWRFHTYWAGLWNVPKINHTVYKQVFFLPIDFPLNRACDDVHGAHLTLFALWPLGRRRKM